MPGTGNGVAVPVGMVCRGIALADIDCAYDTHTQSSVCAEFRILAGDADDVHHNDCRSLHPVFTIRRCHRLDTAAVDLFSVDCRHSVVVLRSDAMA